MRLSLRVVLMVCVLQMIPSLNSFAATSEAPAGPVTQDELRAWTDWTKQAVQILVKHQKKLEADQQAQQKTSPSLSTPSGTGDQAIDLGAVSPTSGTTGTSQADLSVFDHPAVLPKFTTYFDLNFINQPGTPNALAFDNYHTFLFFDIAPTPDLTFSFNLLGPTTYPIFYELDYQATKALTLRAGKIWVPFDDLSPQTPHNVFGGRVGIQQLMPSSTGANGNLFLPSVWTELGVGAKLMVIDTSNLQVETNFCILNGFTDGGLDPVTGSTDYPNFTEYSPATEASSGNHRNKSYAARAHGLLYNRFGLGVSYYTGQWNQDSDPAGHLDLNMIGVDAQADLGLVELRAGIASMNVQLPGTSTRRGGTYIEAGVPFAQKWKFLARGGTLQLDSRIAEATDENIIGATLLYNPGMVQFSIEHSQDIKNPGVAVDNKSYTDLRMVIML